MNEGDAIHCCLRSHHSRTTAAIPYLFHLFTEGGLLRTSQMGFSVRLNFVFYRNVYSGRSQKMQANIRKEFLQLSCITVCGYYQTLKIFFVEHSLYSRRENSRRIAGRRTIVVAPIFGIISKVLASSEHLWDLL